MNIWWSWKRSIRTSCCAYIVTATWTRSERTCARPPSAMWKKGSDSSNCDSTINACRSSIWPVTASKSAAMLPSIAMPSADCSAMPRRWCPFCSRPAAPLDQRVQDYLAKYEVLQAMFLETAGWLAIEAATRQFGIHLRRKLRPEGLGLSPRMGPRLFLQVWRQQGNVGPERPAPSVPAVRGLPAPDHADGELRHVSQAFTLRHLPDCCRKPEWAQKAIIYNSETWPLGF